MLPDQKLLPPFIQDVACSLCELCGRIDALSIQSHLLHPSKCRCLAKSYSALLSHVLTLSSQLSPSSSSSPFLQHELSVLLSVLLHTLQESERFLQDCTYRGWSHWLARSQHEWLVNKALPIALGTEIFDVHLHDFLWCTSTLTWVLADHISDAGPDIRIDEANRVNALLKDTWASAGGDDDVKSMQELVSKIGAKGLPQICNLICERLSENTSEANLNLTDAVVPAYLWMDPGAFEDIRDRVVDSNSFSVVFETRLMGGRFACKHFYRVDDEAMFTHEAVVQARLRHENVVRLVCCTKKGSGGETGGLVMELMDQDLGSLIAKRRAAGMGAPFSLLAAVDLMLQIAKGMEYLHDLGIMHRDLKSLNILVRSSKHASYLGERDHFSVKISDFGSSKVMHNTVWCTTMGVGSGIWRAPEVMDYDNQARYTNKIDVYSFAIVCSEILTGLPPSELFPYHGRSELLKLLKQGKRPELPSSCPPAISSYIEKCWHGDASERPTFRQICTVLRFFKTCILLTETKMLASPLQDGMFNFEELQRSADTERRSEGMHNPVLNIPSEIHVFRSIWEQRRRELLELRG